MEPTILIEQTSKHWKKMKLIAGALVFGGVLVALAVPALGAVILAAGLGVAIYAGVGRWWNHA